MDTTAQVTTTVTEPAPDAPAVAAVTPTTGCGEYEVTGGVNIDEIASKNAKVFFFISIAFAIVVIILIILLVTKRMRLGKAPSGCSSFSSNMRPSPFVERYGNSPNWRYGGESAGGSNDLGNANNTDLGFGVSRFQSNLANKQEKFNQPPQLVTHEQIEAANKIVEASISKMMNKEHALGSRPIHRPQESRTIARFAPEHFGPLPRSNFQECYVHSPHPQKSHMVVPQPRQSHFQENMTAEEQKAQEAAARAYIAARTLDEIGSRQAQVLSGCSNGWDPMATEEAKVLGSIGVYRQASPGMSGFVKNVNDNVPLTDAQLEAIMQGGEPFTPSITSFNKQAEVTNTNR